MKTKIKKSALLVAGLTSLGYAGVANAYTFSLDDGNINGAFNNTFTLGTGIRTQNPSCGEIIGTNGGPGNPAPSFGSGPVPGCLDALSMVNDQGNLNTKAGRLFTTYLDGTSELALRFPNSWQFFTRVNYIKDFSAINPSGTFSGAGIGQSFPQGAESQLSFKARLLDLWVSHSFSIAGQPASFKIGNQVLNWGESLFLPGGINATNSVDVMRLSVPGTQLKEAVLPAPIADGSVSFGHGVSLESYIQAGWNGDYFPPVGSYWSTATIGAGAEHYGAFSASTNYPAWSVNQGGLALRFSPEELQANFALYAMQYTDKAPVIGYSDPSTFSGAFYHYLPHRVLFGASTNFQIGDWALGGEVSYRPRDAVSLNTLGSNNVNGLGCLANGQCYVDEQKVQVNLTALLSMTPSDYGWLLRMLGNASTATLMAEAAFIDYPGLKNSYQGVPVAAGYWGWGFDTPGASGFTTGQAGGKGTAFSWGYNVDFSWTYDGNLMKGWQVTPQIYYFQSVAGYTPNAMALFMKGAKSANISVTFTQNPADWSFGVNYAKFWGPGVLEQPLLGRDYVGLFLTKNL
ncbi:DUF1302 domain-containing protein [Paraburkholderia dinghuensis]|uniref:DUF1302 family protein n=1 Tax=Paraburkholderia dinghuensis TaxID=2305225 RepID=A0A3N6MYY1_9BURK|nr:DUF1302 family protein [Paraburkholderia dinghuensis]RQH08989.1 DUF1302 family protein [Paraburkholderia dinghuensis]